MYVKLCMYFLHCGYIYIYVSIISNLVFYAQSTIAVFSGRIYICGEKMYVSALCIVDIYVWNCIYVLCALWTYMFETVYMCFVHCGHICLKLYICALCIVDIYVWNCIYVLCGYIYYCQVHSCVHRGTVIIYKCACLSELHCFHTDRLQNWLESVNY